MTPVEEWDEEGPFQLGLRDGAGDMGRGEHPQRSLRVLSRELSCRCVHRPWSVPLYLARVQKASRGLGRSQVSCSAACLPQLRGPS